MMLKDTLTVSSLGEFAALAISGALGVEDMLRIVTTRAKLMTTKCAPGASGMLACKLSPLEAETILNENSELSDLSVACRNSTNDCVIAGSLDQISRFEQICSNGKAKTKRLEVPYGFHSPAMDPIVRPLEELGRSIQWSPFRIPVVSEVYGVQCDKNICTSNYFALHARQPVRFVDGIQTLTSHGVFRNAVCLEIGPHPITLPMIQATLGSVPCTYIPTLHRDRLAWTSLSASLSQLWVLTDTINWRKVFAGSLATTIDLPGYPLEGMKFSVPYRENIQIAPRERDRFEPYTSTGFVLLPRLKNRQSLEDTFSLETTSAILGPLITGHIVGGVAICPASVFHEMMLEAGRMCLEPSEQQIMVVQDLTFASSLTHTPSEVSKPVCVRLTKKDSDESAGFEITVRDNNGAQEKVCCSGIVNVKNRHDLRTRWLRDAEVVKRQTGYLLDGTSESISTFQSRVLYEVIFPRVVQYTKEYQSLSNLNVSTTGLEGIGSFKLPEVVTSEGYVGSHVFTDTLLHAAGFIANIYVDADKVCICAHVEAIEILYDEINYSETFTVYCSLFDVVKGSIIADAVALNGVGQTIAIVRGMDFRKVGSASFRRLLQMSTMSPPENSDEDTGSPSTEGSPSPQNSDTQASLTGLSTPIPGNEDQSGQRIRRTIARLVSDVCGCSKQYLDFESPLTALGFDSLMHIELVEKLRKAFSGGIFDANRLGQCETLLALECEIRANLIDSVKEVKAKQRCDVPTDQTALPSEPNAKSESQTPSTPLQGKSLNPVSLRISDRKAIPIHLFHDGSGQVSLYRRIQDMGRSIFAFFDHRMLTSDLRHTSLVEMAADYASTFDGSDTRQLLLGGRCTLTL